MCFPPPLGLGSHEQSVGHGRKMWYTQQVPAILSQTVKAQGGAAQSPGAKRWDSQSGYGEARKELEMEPKKVGLNNPALLDAPEPRARTK